MESTLSTTTLFTISKTLNPYSNQISRLHRHFSTTPLSQCFQSRLLTRRLRCLCNGSNSFISISSLRSLPPVRSRLHCVSSSAASFGSSGGGGRGNGGFGGGGGGDSGSDGREVKSKSVGGGSEEVSALSPEVIILDVTGMTCGGCAASVKRILESQPQVSSANVNLTTETAIVWPVSEAKVVPNWRQELGESLAKHLTSCGFKSNLRGQEDIEGDIPS